MIPLEVINNQVKVQGVTPSNISEFNNPYDRNLTIRNGADLLTWMLETNKCTKDEVESLKLMLYSDDIEDFNMTLILIKNINDSKII